MPANPRLLSAIVITFNSAGHVATAMASVRAAARAAGWSVEFVVVDNASADASVEAAGHVAPDAVVIRNPMNAGFGAANNQAFEVARGDYWLLLNPDAALSPDALPPLTAFLDERADAAGVGPSVESAGAAGAESSGMAPSIRSLIGHFLFLNRLLPYDRGGALRGFQLHRRSHPEPRRVDWLGGMALLLRPSAVREVAGFDATIFMYGEDVDLGRRLREAGWTLWLLPAARAKHLVAASQGGVSARWIDAVHDLYARRARRSQLVVFDAVLAAGLAVRALAMAWRRPGHHDVHRRRIGASARRAAHLLTGSIAGGRGRIRSLADDDPTG